MSEGKWISDLKATTPLVDAAKRALRIRLQVVRERLAKALENTDEDPEHVHQLRVATRRAGAAVEIFALCLSDKVYTAARQQLRCIRRAAGEVRDWDLFLLRLAEEKEPKNKNQWPGLDFLTGYAVGQRSIAQAQLKEACGDYPSAFERLLAETVDAVHKPHYDPGTRTLGDLAGPLLLNLLKDLSEAAGRNLKKYDRLHRVRILGKRLRYAMEVFADCFGPSVRVELYPEVEEMQEILGRANDSRVALDQLDLLRDEIRATRPDEWKRIKPAFEALKKYHQEQLPKERGHFLEWWERWQKCGRESAFVHLLQRRESTASVDTGKLKH